MRKHKYSLNIQAWDGIFMGPNQRLLLARAFHEISGLMSRWAQTLID
jgi:hypothetical protein